MPALARTHEPGMARVRVLAPGLFTTLQDAGRPHHRRLGVPLGGALDALALCAANRLVGNPEDSAVLEVTGVGPKLWFEAPAAVAICGADFAAYVDGEPLPIGRPIWLGGGAVLEVQKVRRGFRGYLAIRGGFRAEPVLDSRSALPRYGIGKRLAAGDEIAYLPGPTAPPAGFRPVSARAAVAPFQVGGWLDQIEDEIVILRVVRGEQADWFGEGARRAFFERTWQVAPQSDRMGVRLRGEPLAAPARQLASEPVVPGSVQVPQDGLPIVLMRECQTTGGYPKLATVISADLDKLAHLRPGSFVRFVEVSVEEAFRLRGVHHRLARVWLRWVAERARQAWDSEGGD
ncbi:biotin-dependent carboxyltransferase family protein [Alicyclobacillus sendaiensis]|uniref:Biotin-dependent carboxyltransferase family protein n=1 Tax=Alicyclobacillus sendaiensis PA2 TaxID=3029425 RepID=A0ABT6XUT6_ALISE|nr:biotin-dependent carboxyltransferase family protein [Alicyclobacillus sendaiensis]MDI9258798.1 biotin-dependent carboxyltransferase family protein [Alicyclobacillus sendaiensis PA2]